MVRLRAGRGGLLAFEGELAAGEQETASFERRFLAVLGAGGTLPFGLPLTLLPGVLGVSPRDPSLKTLRVPS